MLEILEDELRSAMGLLGVTRLSELDPSYVQRGAPAVSTPSALTAFPLRGPDGGGGWSNFDSGRAPSCSCLTQASRS